MRLYRIFLTGTALFAIALPGLAESIKDGYRPQNSAQRNYKACKPDAIMQGLKTVVPFCGALPERPKFPSYDEAWNRTSKAELDAYALKLSRFEAEVSRYQTCITTRVMADGALSTNTLNYAACADQGAVEQLAESTEEWGMSCMAFNDSRTKNKAYTKPCFPAQ
jgi:hypothetical protein